MAFRNIAVSITANTPTLLFTAKSGDVEAWGNIDHNETYYIGGPSVTTSNGLKLFANSNGTFRTTVMCGDELWVVAANAVDVNAMVRSV